MIAIFALFTILPMWVSSMWEIRSLKLGNVMPQPLYLQTLIRKTAIIYTVLSYICVYIYITIPRRTNVASYVKKQQLNRVAVAVWPVSSAAKRPSSRAAQSVSRYSHHFQWAVVTFGYAAFVRANTVCWRYLIATMVSSRTFLAKNSVFLQLRGVGFFSFASLLLSVWCVSVLWRSPHTHTHAQVLLCN